MAETTPAAVYKTSDNLNVRSEPSTSGNKLGLLPAGTIVDYVEDYDSEWAVINYDGTQAYVSKQFLVHDWSYVPRLSRERDSVGDHP